MTKSKSATLYQIVLPDHICPFGVHARNMLEDAGYEIDEHILHTREEVAAFEREQGVDTRRRSSSAESASAAATISNVISGEVERVNDADAKNTRLSPLPH